MTNAHDDIVAAWCTELRCEGWCIIPDALPPATIAALDADLAETFERTPFCKGGFYGATTKRFGRLLARSAHAAALVQHSVILGITEAILSPWCDCIQLNTTQAIAVHPGAPAQFPHRDQDMWAAPKGEIEYLVNVIWPLTPFRAENGATRIWPRSHGAQALLPEPDRAPVAAEMAPGSAVVFLGSTLHSAGANESGEVRRGVVVGYSLGWLKPYENPWLAYPPEVARRLSPELAALAGYRQHRPNLGNFEGQCPSVLLGDYAGEPLAAVDALRPDQQAMINAYAEEQADVR
ncbi:phytanoyl-CoA dioxygenase family protein [Sphingomonas cannabina]|uniref:phytanoyl-CoA dioxygenase family protein n=1 Tax=Sphingomonas cannabina TaxID=2899123 RepID=UPI001F2782F0|nr:phytanoyl-CoA dioxygenase family protein [Sphingomonas cannabina]UIJ46348.1 phytanoyl-CoA dioxygenase family protein [Sphingomonas cannabina]